MDFCQYSTGFHPVPVFSSLRINKSNDLVSFAESAIGHCTFTVVNLTYSAIGHCTFTVVNLTYSVKSCVSTSWVHVTGNPSKNVKCPLNLR